MNHIHRIIFNRAVGVYQAVSETASAGRGAGTTSVASAATVALALACAPA